MGAALGGAFGSGVHRLFPTLTAPTGAYALVAMAAVFGGAAHAPITAILIIFEMTGDYRIILPLMTAVVIGTLVSYFLGRETIYTIKLRRRGIDILARRGQDPLTQIRVAQIMVRDVVSLQDTLRFHAILDSLRRYPFTSFPVVDGGGRLLGMVGYDELRGLLMSGRVDERLTARDLMRVPLTVTHPDETLADVVEKFRATQVGRLPVVSRDAPHRLVGIVSGRDVLTAYQQATLSAGRDR